MRMRQHLAMLFAAVGGACLSLPAAGDVFMVGSVNPAAPDPTKNLYIGEADDSFGSLLVEFGAVASNQAGYLGFGARSIGSAMVTDADSAWINAGPLNVGHLGIGSLNISAGGSVSALSSYLGAYEGSQGAANVSDSGSAWTTANGLHIGNLGDGSLTVKSGGKISAMDIDLGFAAGVTGSAIIEGAGAELKATYYLNVGGHGVGTITVRNGALLSNQHGYIGTDLRPPDNSPGADGSVTVSNATWTNSGTLVVSFTSKGSLEVTNGGKVTSASGIIGRIEGFTGTVAIVGTGSAWTSSGDLTIGSIGAAEVNLTGGGKLTNQFGIVGELRGSDTVFGKGSITVDGEGSAWTSTRAAVLGFRGEGKLVVRNGGDVTSQTAYLAADPAGSADAEVNGIGSTWTSTLGLIVGGFGLDPGGSAKLAIRNGGEVSGGVRVKLFSAGVIDLDNGKLTAPLIDNAGTIRGNGTILGNLANSGTLDIGHSVGAMRIMGDYAQTPGGLLIIDIDADDQFDALTVAGQAALGGQVLFRFNYDPAETRTYDFLSAAGITSETWSWSVSGLNPARVSSVADGAITVNVPEPSTLMTLAVAGGLLLRRRRFAA